MADQKRRKTFRNVFKKTDAAHVTIAPLSGPPSPIEKRSDFSASASPADSSSSSPKLRPRILQKSSRTSVFGSIRSLHSLDEDEKAKLTRSNSKTSSINEEGAFPLRWLYGESVLRHGEISTAGTGVFRKRTYYVVLTDSHLIRFKTQAKAAEVFPSLSTSPNRSPMLSRNSYSSASSLADLQVAVQNDLVLGVPLENVVAVYKLDDGRPTWSIEICHLDESANVSGTVQLQFSEAQEADSWLMSIRSQAASVRQHVEVPFLPQTTEYAVRVLERECDYDPQHFQLFKVMRLVMSKFSNRTGSEELIKNSSQVCYLAIGLNKIHFIPAPRTFARGSSTSLPELDVSVTVGLLALSHVGLQRNDDVFRLQFEIPFSHKYSFTLASSQACDVVLWLRYACEYLRPQWTTQPFVFDVPSELEDNMDPPLLSSEDYNCFDQTLIAYCVAYEADPSRIVYSVDDGCEDAPCFRLLKPLSTVSYSIPELMAVLRTLRYNEYFCSISFADIDLRVLRDLYKSDESDVDSLSSRSGVPVDLGDHANLPVLSQELRALALKSRRLRRLDLSNALSKSAGSSDQFENSGIPQAITPLCKKSLTNVDWLVLNGIQLGEHDVEHLVDAASERRCHFRALEVGGCGLSVHDVDVILSALAVHEHTMEVIDISSAQGRFSPELFQRSIGTLGHIRRLNLSRIQKTAGPDPLLSPEILFTWRLEALHLSQTSLNERAVDTISAYLFNPRSDTLRELHINQCGLTGSQLAVLLQSMTRRRGEGRRMHVNASENRLSVGSHDLARSLANNNGPTSLSLRMMDFEKEHHFRELIDALAQNSTLESLDISRASLPYDASEETCEALKVMLAKNQTLQELDISGEHTHLDAARFGIGLNIALRGLEHNKTLKLLRIEHQNLGLQGASTLAGVLEANQSLFEIYCEHNDINLQSFTVLVNALHKNRTLLFMPALEQDQARSMEKVRDEFEKVDQVDEQRPRSSHRAGPLKKGLTAISTHVGQRASHVHMHHRKTSSMASSVSFTEQDVMATLSALEEKWQHQRRRMQRFLQRNHQLANGMSLSGVDGDEVDEFGTGSVDARPATSESIGKLLARVKLDRTPIVERSAPFDGPVGKPRTDLPTAVFTLPEA